MASLDDTLNLKRAWSYQSPRRSSDCLPLVYGGMQGGSGGLWPLVCLDTANHVYALAGHPLLPLAAGNHVTLYDRQGLALDPASYTLDLAHDLEGQGPIATAIFLSDVSSLEPLSVRAQGKPGPDGELIANPLEVARDLLVAVGGLAETAIHQETLSRARARAQALGWRASGAILKPKSLASHLTELLSTFLGSWWLAGDGLLRLHLDLGPGSASDGELATSLSQAHLANISVQASLADLVNQAQSLFCLNRVSGEYEAGDDGLASRDLVSQSLHGPQVRCLEMAWVREAAIAQAIGASLVNGYGYPRRVITCQEDALTNLPLEKGDVALLSLDWLYDRQGRPLVNRVVRVLGLEPQLDKGVITFTLVDTGYHKTTAWPADGSCRADGSQCAGSGQDLTEYLT